MQDRRSSTARGKAWLILLRGAQLAAVSLVPIAVGCKVGVGGTNRMRKKKNPLDKGREARRLARSAAAAPAATKVVPDKRKKPEKHKQKWREERE
jgi:hypothetical protein